MCPGVNYGKLLKDIAVDEEAIKQLYNDDNAPVKNEGLLSKPLPVSKGLFNVYR
jgi:hypothetical protein